MMELEPARRSTVTANGLTTMNMTAGNSPDSLAMSVAASIFNYPNGIGLTIG